MGSLKASLYTGLAGIDIPNPAPDGSMFRNLSPFVLSVINGVMWVVILACLAGIVTSMVIAAGGAASGNNFAVKRGLKGFASCFLIAALTFLGPRLLQNVVDAI